MWQPSLRLERPEVEWLSLSFVHCHRNPKLRHAKDREHFEKFMADRDAPKTQE